MKIFYLNTKFLFVFENESFFKTKGIKQEHIRFLFFLDLIFHWIGHETGKKWSNLTFWKIQKTT